MADQLPTYTQRQARISAILQPYLHVSRYLLWRLEPDLTEDPNALACRWFDRKTGRQEVAVIIKPLGDIDHTLNWLRKQVTGDDYYDRGMASTVTGLGPGEYAFLQHYVNAVTAIVGNCAVTVGRPHERADLHALVEPALEIARTVGCSAYDDDFVQPEYPAEWPKSGWWAASADPNAPHTDEA